MCRKCGEPDRRGGAPARRASKLNLLKRDGDGTTCPCYWCGTPLTFATLERDRLQVGGPYALWNLVPACGPCNRARTYEEQLVPDGCYFGAGVSRLAAAAC